MSYTVSPGSALGRLGAGIGQGLSTQIPEEIQRYRLASGLKKLSETQNLNPEQYLAQAFSIPGMTPAMAEQFGQLARMRAKGQAAGQGLRPQEQIQETPQQIAKKGFQPQQQIKQPEEKKAPSLTRREGLEEKLNPTLPMTPEEKIKKAEEILNYNPAIVNHNLDKALEIIDQEDKANLQRSQLLQNVHTVQQGVQDRIKTDLGNVAKMHNVQLPSNIYQKYENEAVRLMLPKDQGGEALTEQEATQELIPELDKISRDYKSVDNLGDWLFTWSSPESTVSNIKNLRNKFSERDDLENFADTLIGKNDLSNGMGYSLAYPLESDEKNFDFIKNIKKIDPILSNKNPTQETNKILFKLIDNFNPKTSPLSVAFNLQRKGYDPQPYLNYLINNRKQLKLSDAQGRQLDKPEGIFPKINDLHLMRFLRPIGD